VVWVDSCTVEAAGVVTLPTPVDGDSTWQRPLRPVRRHRVRRVLRSSSGASSAVEPGRTRARGRSRPTSPGGPVQHPEHRAHALPRVPMTGNITLTASKALFKSTHVGALFSLTSTGQTVTTTSATNGRDDLRHSGDRPRQLAGVLHRHLGDASGSTVDLQRSYDNATWANVGGAFTWTAERHDNAERRAGQPDRLLPAHPHHSGGSRHRHDDASHRQRQRARHRSDYRLHQPHRGRCRGAEGAGRHGCNTMWQEGMWSDLRGWPTSGGFHEGRLWWFGSTAFGALSRTLMTPSTRR
jgi:hypothetical protein